MCLQYAVTHEDFAWSIRGEPGVVGAFEKVYDNKDLIVSFDAINFTLPYVRCMHLLNKLTVIPVALILHQTSLGLIKTRTPKGQAFAVCKVW